MGGSRSNTVGPCAAALTHRGVGVLDRPGCFSGDMHDTVPESSFQAACRTTISLPLWLFVGLVATGTSSPDCKGPCAVDGSNFDAWTRRRVHLALGGGLAGVVSVLTGLNAEGKQSKKKDKKKKKKKVKCAKRVGLRCTEKVPCCKGTGLQCLPPLSNPTSARCCLAGRKACTTNAQCCSGTCEDGACLCKGAGQQCAGVGAVCCSLNCVGTGDEATCQ